MGRVLVIGGGAAGLMAAIAAAEKGASVALWEGGGEPGKKILATGNGKCNFTNLRLSPQQFRTQCPALLEPLLATFSPEDAVSFFRELGVAPSARNGYVYPRSEQAASIRDALVWRAKELAVQMECGRKVESLHRTEKGFLAQAGTCRMQAEAVVLAAGGKAAPATGSDGSGYRLAQSLGHSLVPVTPALVQLTAKGFPFRKVAGVRTQARIRLLAKGCVLSEDTGELQLTDYGISGIPVFQVSRFASQALEAGGHPEAQLDFFPEEEAETLRDAWRQRQQSHPAWRSGDFLNGLLPRKLAEALLSQAGISLEDTWGQIPEKKLERLLALCKQLTVEITGTKGFGSAQACAGGIPLTEVDASLESHLAPGLFLAGELLDVDGICGGYNLHWAWTSGRLAGQGAARYVRPKKIIIT